jgi:GntR family transcriptional regulator
MTDPKYRQVANDLRRQIESGQLPAGAQLPSEPELMEHYDVSRNTVRDALRLLATRRLVDTQAGRGTFVIERFKPFVITLSEDPETGLGGGEGDAYVREVSELGRQPRTSEPQVEIQRATGRVARELRLAEGDQVVGRHQRRYIDETPWSIQTSFYPMDLVTRGATDLIVAAYIQAGTVNYLEQALNVKQAGYQDRIRVRTPTDEEMRFFGLSDTEGSVIETYRTAYDVEGRPFRLTVSVFPADRNNFIINVGDVPGEVTTPQWITGEA